MPQQYNFAFTVSKHHTNWDAVTTEEALMALIRCLASKPSHFCSADESSLDFIDPVTKKKFIIGWQE